jgi:8-oxo-dGTP diphosphatase
MKTVVVAAAAICDGQGNVLLALRPDHAHLGGHWEFPGGKVEGEESIAAALRREIHEELGIEIESAAPLIKTGFRYPEKRVLLEVWRVESWSGELHGREGQQIEWVPIAQLQDWTLPPADVPIVRALQLPSIYCITPIVNGDDKRFLARLRHHLASGISLVQLRDHTLDAERFSAVARRAMTVCDASNVTLLLNCEPALARELNAAGVHLSSRRLMSCSERPLDADRLVGASCHNEAEVQHACDIDADFIVISPICATPSHPGAEPLGWNRFRQLAEGASMPVYALGGLESDAITTAQACGGQGVAGIRCWWT